MTAPRSRPSALADQLLDAQVRYHLDRLSGDRLAPTVTGLAESLFAAAGEHQLAGLVDREGVKEVVRRALATVPGSAAVSGIVEMAATVLRDGPAEPYPIGEVVERDRVAVLVDELLALHPVVDRALARLVESPLVGTMASRFMGRIVGEVLQANKAVADRVPGLGQLMSFGTSAASRVVGAADRQFEGLIGDTMGKGGAFAVRRLNAIVIETLRDPTTRDALMQVWDLVAEEQVRGPGGAAGRDDLAGVRDAVHDLMVSTLAKDRVGLLGDAMVDGFFERFGGYSPTELLDELDLDRGDVITDLVRFAPGVVDALRETGDLERILREILEPFYASPEVEALLEA